MKKYVSQKGFTVIEILFAVACISVIILLGLFIAHRQAEHSRSTKAAKVAIDKEAAGYSPPSNCTQKDKSYNQGDGLDSVPMWTFVYDCKDSIKALDQAIKNTAETSGAKICYSSATPLNNAPDIHVGSTISLVKNGYKASYSISEPTNNQPMPSTSNLRLTIELRTKYNC